jgi:RNA polymerase sigma factor (sigma-70 family)
LEHKKIILGDLESDQYPYNKEVFEKIVVAYRPRMMRLCAEFPIIGGFQAEDLIQDVFIELVKTVTKGIKKKDVPVEAWLFAHLRWKCLNEAKRRERELRIEEVEEDELIDSALLPEKSSEYKELQQALIDCLNQLTDRERMVIKLTMQGFMIVGIAEKLKITPKAVYSIFHRAKLKLRKLLQTRGFDGVY